MIELSRAEAQRYHWPQRVGARPLFDDLSACRFVLPALDLGVDAAALRTLSRPRRLAPTRNDGDAVHQFLQPRDRICEVPVEAAVPLCLDDDHAFDCDALVLMRDEMRL